ncbi:MAG: adenylate kinase [Waddliaceae bacterium]
MLKLAGILMIGTAILPLGINAMVSNSSSSQKVIILLGPPGSGKGTQAKQITRELQIPHISTGDLFRENMSKNTAFGQRAKAYIDQGKLVPDEVVLDMLFDRVAKDDCKAGYLLDGFPRTIPQAETLDRHLKNKAHQQVINLEVSDEIVIKRISGRLTCTKCGIIFNKYFSPPEDEKKCEECGGELIQRDDDRPEVVKERLRVYYAQTAPLVKYYGDKGILTTFDGEQDPETIYKQIISHLKSPKAAGE